ncbi:MAG: Crp/Fnr family transcriptional regulator [Actinomycetota bacterium]|nr:Crp/Fnr family transcriptional regulator [Actinomycetota bacterium]
MDKIQALKNCKLFMGLPDDNLRELASIAIERNYGQDDVIFSDGDIGEGFYVIVSGRVKLFKLGPDGREQIIHFAFNGDPFAEVTLFSGVSYPVFAKACTRLETLFFRRDDFKKLIVKNPQISLNMIAIMSHHLRRFAALIEELSLKDVPARVAKYLLDLPMKPSSGQDGVIEVELDLSKTELAKKLGTISETISRTLGKMKSIGVIEIDGRRVKILDADMLEEIASGLKK